MLQAYPISSLELSLNLLRRYKTHEAQPLS